MKAAKKVFICYRRSDSPDASRLAEFIASHFGSDSVFFDTRSMNPGDDWPDSIRRSLMTADLMLLVIGPNWLTIQDEKSGRRKIDIESDWVRKEILTFLKLKKNGRSRLLIPVLVNGAIMPEKKYLDRLLTPLINKQYIALDTKENLSDEDFNEIMTILEKKGFTSVIHTPEPTPPGPEIKELSKKEEMNFLNDYPQWKVVEHHKPGAKNENIKELYRMFRFNSYEDAWAFLSKVDKNAIRKLNHHPRWENSYRRVEFWLSTSNIGNRLSLRDIRLAKLIEKIRKEFT